MTVTIGIRQETASRIADLIIAARREGKNPTDQTLIAGGFSQKEIDDCRLLVAALVNTAFPEDAAEQPN